MVAWFNDVTHAMPRILVPPILILLAMIKKYLTLPEKAFVQDNNVSWSEKQNQFKKAKLDELLAQIIRTGVVTQ